MFLFVPYQMANVPLPPPLKFNYVITCNDTEANLRQQSSQDDKYMGVR